MPLDPGTLARLTGPTRELWTAIAGALTAAEMKDTVFDLLAGDLCRRFRTDRSSLRQLRAYPRPVLVRDLDGYWIEPHPDTQAKIVTMQFYLARDLSQRHLGTALYRLHLWNWRVLISPRAALRKFKQFDFAPNSGYGFAVGRTSWHGREKIPDAAGVRHSLMHVYYRDPDRGW
jgi:hypothetical protein